MDVLGIATEAYEIMKAEFAKFKESSDTFRPYYHLVCDPNTSMKGHHYF
jgi:hypothetical protein